MGPSGPSLGDALDACLDGAFRPPPSCSGAKPGSARRIRRRTDAPARARPRTRRRKTNMNHLSRSAAIATWVAQVAAAAILLQTLFFKFTGAEESRFIFSTLGVEPWGRIVSGVLELVAALLLLFPGTAALGAVLAGGIMAGAVLSHLFVLGIEVRGDGGLLFTLALIVLLCSATVTVLRRGQLPLIGCKFA